MHLVNYDSKLNSIYVQFHNDMTTLDIDDALLKVKNIIRKKMTEGFTLVFNLEGVEIDIIKKHINKLKQVQILMSIKKVNKIIRIGDLPVLKVINNSFDELYMTRDKIPTILQFQTTSECITYIPDLDLWFGTLLIK